MKKLNQKGFSPFEITLLLLVVAALGFAGYTVWQNNKSESGNDNSVTSKATPEQSKLYTDTAKKFTFEYPITWEASNPEPGGRDFLGDKPVETPDWTQVSRDVEVKPFKGHKDNNIRIIPGITQEYVADVRAKKDKFHTQTDIKVNGYDTLYDKLEFKGDAETYVDHTYYVLKGETYVMFTFRESHHHDMSNTKYDDKQNLPGFESIVKSVKFTD